MGGKQILALILTLLSVGLVHADGWDCRDPDVVLCMDLTETHGAIAFDRARYANHGTLNGGPARVLQASSFNPSLRFSSTTTAMMPAQYVRFTRTIGEYIASPDEARLDLVTTPFMIAFTMQLDSMVGADRVIMSYSDGDETTVNSSKGWHFRNTGGANLIYGHIGIADFQFNSAIPDLKPHTIVVWDRGDGLIYEFMDGKLDRIHTGGGIGTAGTGYFSITRRNNTGQAKWGGGVAYVRIKKNVQYLQIAIALANQYHIMVNRYNNQ